MDGEREPGERMPRTRSITRAACTPVTVNQQANGGQFNLLGTFSLNGSSTITLTDNANGYVIADAIQLISTAPPQATTLLHLYRPTEYATTHHQSSPAGGMDVGER